jgi:hypothetical protein
MAPRGCLLSNRGSSLSRACSRFPLQFRGRSDPFAQPLLLKQLDLTTKTPRSPPQVLFYSWQFFFQRLVADKRSGSQGISPQCSRVNHLAVVTFFSKILSIMSPKNSIFNAQLSYSAGKLPNIAPYRKVERTKSMSLRLY